jgi:hypothetical protein
MALSDEEKELIKAAAEGATKGIAERTPPVYTDLLRLAVKELVRGWPHSPGLKKDISFHVHLVFSDIEPPMCLKALYNLQRLGIANPFGPMNVGQFKALQLKTLTISKYSTQTI